LEVGKPAKLTSGLENRGRLLILTWPFLQRGLSIGFSPSHLGFGHADDLDFTLLVHGALFSGIGLL